MRIFLTYILLQLCACSTIGTLAKHESGSGQNIVYSGAKMDWIVVGSPLEAGGDTHLGYGIFILYPFFVIDLALCAIADTLMLPYTITESMSNDEHGSHK